MPQKGLDRASELEKKTVPNVFTLGKFLSRKAQAFFPPLKIDFQVSTTVRKYLGFLSVASDGLV